MRTYLLAGIVGICTFFGTATAASAYFSASESFALPDGEAIPENAYVLANHVAVEGVIQGDLTVMAGDAIVSGTIEGDLLVLAGSVQVTGEVRGDVRVVTGNAAIDGTVGGDLVSMAGQTVVASGAQIGARTYVASEHARLMGAQSDDVRVWASNAEIGSTIGGSSYVRVSQALSIMDTARIEGKLAYRAPREALLSEGAEIGGGIEYEPAARSFQFDEWSAAALSAFAIVSLIAVAASAAVLAALFPRFTERSVRFALTHGGRTILIGVAVWILTPVLAAVLLISAVGLYAGIALGAFFVAFVILAKVLAAAMAGALLSQWIRGETNVAWYWAALGAVSLWLLGYVPVLGALVNMVFAAAMTGSLAEGIRHHWWQNRKLKA